MFTNCYALSEVELETKATELPAEMFVGCSSLEHIVIPAGVKVIGSSCFAGTAISAFEVDPGNAAFKAFSGILYNGEQVLRYAAFPVDAVGTNGSGDVFHGAFAFALTQGYAPEKCCVFASAVAARK
jgi:hypothetical protein